MKSNEKQLSDAGRGLAEIEGRLNHKRAHKTVFKERWFKLRCNLLFYFNINECGQIETKPAGIIVLENYVITADSAFEGEFAFSIIFRDDYEKRHVFTGRTELQVDSWVTALRCASYEFWRLKLVTLREQLSAKTGQDPLLMHPRNQATVRDSTWITYFSGYSNYNQSPKTAEIRKDTNLIDFS